MDDLPELPFEKVLSYLSLEEVIKLRAVSRSCLWKIDNYKVKHLCYTRVPIGHIVKKHRWISGAFAQNFIVSIRFESFFKTFGRSILSHLRHLRLYDPDLHAGSPAAFTDALESFVQLEELDLIGKWILGRDYKRRQLKLNLNLRLLKSVQIDQVLGIEKVTLDAPVLKKVKIGGLRSRLFLDLVHGESVESLLIDRMSYLKVESLKNLKTIYIGPYAEIDFPLLFSLEQLKIIHLTGYYDFGELFDLKQRHGRVDLQFYRLGYLLSGPDDPMIESYFDDIHGPSFRYLAENPSRMADPMPFWSAVSYKVIEHMDPQLQANIFSQLTDLDCLVLDWPVQDIDRFLSFLQNFSRIETLEILCDQPQALFDRLPEHSCLQKLNILVMLSDFKFLVRLKSLVDFNLSVPIDIEFIRMVLEELPFLEHFVFKYPKALFQIGIPIETPKRFEVYFDGRKKMINTRDLNTVIQFIEQNMSREVNVMEVDD